MAIQNELSFERDQGKSESNLRKHGILFEESVFVFSDPNRTFVPDEGYSYGEDRFVAYGCIDNRLFPVVFTPDLAFEIVRIKSARKANASERKLYRYRATHH